MTPWSSATTPEEETAVSVVGVEAPVEGKAIEFDIFLLDRSVSRAGWPGKNSMGTQLIGKYELPGGESVCVVWWEIDMPNLSRVQGRPRFYEGRSMDDLRTAEGLRMLGFTDASDGSRVIYDLVMKHREGSS